MCKSNSRYESRPMSAACLAAGRGKTNRHVSRELTDSSELRIIREIWFLPCSATIENAPKAMVDKDVQKDNRAIEAVVKK